MTIFQIVFKMQGKVIKKAITVEDKLFEKVKFSLGGSISFTEACEIA